MKKSVSRSIPLLILCSLLITLPKINIVKASGTIYIRADGSVEGTDKIHRDGNVYTFTDNTNDSIVVERDNIVVDGAGYTMQGYYRGIDLSHRSNVTIKNTQMISFHQGIYLDGSLNNNIIGNNITDSLTGIDVHRSSNDNNVSGNNIEASETRGILIAYSSNNIISGNNIKNSRSSVCFGIELSGSSNNSIIGNTVTGNHLCGIRLSSSSNNSISANHVTNNDGGLYLEHSSNNNIISANNVMDNNLGILIDWSSNNILRNNHVKNNTYNFKVVCGFLSDWINDIDVSNTVNGKPIYYWVNERDKTVPSNAGYVGLVNCTGVTVENLNLANNGQGIVLAYTTNSTITKNSITNSEYGIFLYYSSYNTVNGNKIGNIRLSGIELGENSNSNSISGNNIEASVREGINLFMASNNRIIGNNITNNNVGIFFGGSPNNIIYRNNFINNTKQVSDFYYEVFFGHASLNIWDDGEEGNYWSNYNGTDNDKDGIGDTPYIIYANNTDKYPLMNPVVNPESPDDEKPTKPTTNPFPTTWIAAAIAIIAVVVAALLIYFRKIRKTTGEIKEQDLR